MRFKRPSLLSAALATGLAFPTPLLADFTGGDTLETAIVSNWNYYASGGGLFDSRNSRLEYTVASPASENLAILAWKVNQGGYQQNWFIQVDAGLAALPVAEEGEGTELSLGVNPSEDNGPRSLTIAMNRYRENGAAGTGISVVEEPGNNTREQQTNARSATLRLHYDKASKTITPSWNTGGGWIYAPARSLEAWGMKSSETFQAVLLARNGASDPKNAVIASGQAWFRNFKTGNATPDIVVETSSSSEIKDKQGTVPFGAAKTGVGKVVRTFRIRNHGTAVLSKFALTTLGSHAKDFTFTKPGKALLVPGGSTTFKITFRPRTTGVRKATVFLTSTDPDESSFEIKVSGRGVD